MEFWRYFSVSEFSSYLSILIINRFNRPVVFIHTSRADLQFKLTCKICCFLFQDDTMSSF